MSKRVRPAAHREPSITTYAFAHFGKSLWWNGSELFLAFYLTEHLRLAPLAAGAAIATGLAMGAVFDLLIGKHLARFSGVWGAARMQFSGAAVSTLALLLIALAAVTAPEARLPIVIGANIVYRFAYALYDLPQNCILSLTPWTADQRRRAAASRTAAGALALLLMASIVSVDQPQISGSIHAVIAALMCAIALSSAALLFWESRGLRDEDRPASPVDGLGPTLSWPLVLMALVCLTSPAFSKLAPYVASYAPTFGAQMPLVLIGIATIISQPAWVALVRGWGEIGAGIAAASLLIAAALSIDTFWLAALLAGAAGGGFGTVIWSGFATGAVGQDPSATAFAFARLTASAKIALAVAALAIGTILDAADYHHDGAGLLPFMRGLVLLGGILTGAYLLLIAWIRRERLAGSG